MPNNTKNELKIKRQYDQTKCCHLAFDVLSFFGNVTAEDDLPSQLTVSFVPASFERLNHARKVVDSGSSLVGIRVRNNDIQDDLSSCQPTNCRVVVEQAGNGNYQIDLQFTCRNSGCYITAGKEVSADWFDEVLV